MKKRIISILGIASLLVSLTACSQAVTTTGQTSVSNDTTNVVTETSSEQTTESEHVTIRLADQAVNQILYFNYAKEKGILDEYFKDYDVDFEISDFASGPAVNEAIAADQLDFSVEGNLPSVTGPIGGYGTEVVAILAVSTASAGAIATPADSDVQTLEDTKGRTVGTAIGTAYHYSLGRFYEEAGISLDEVNLINAGTDVSTALRAGEIEAGFVTLPQAEILEGEGSARVISDELIVTAPAHYFIASKKFAESHPELTATLLNAIQATEDAILEDPEGFKAFYTDYLGADSSPYVKSLLSYDLKVTNVNELAVNEITSILGWLGRNGLVDTTGKTAEDVYDNTYANLAGLSD